MSSTGEPRKATEEDMLMRVKNLIIQCLKRLMTKEETVSALARNEQIEPRLTEHVWQKLENRFVDSFKRYYTKLMEKRQISRNNELVQNQAAESMHEHPPPDHISGGALMDVESSMRRPVKRLKSTREILNMVSPSPDGFLIRKNGGDHHGVLGAQSMQHDQHNTSTTSSSTTLGQSSWPDSTILKTTMQQTQNSSTTSGALGVENMQLSFDTNRSSGYTVVRSNPEIFKFMPTPGLRSGAESSTQQQLQISNTIFPDLTNNFFDPLDTSGWFADYSYPKTMMNTANDSDIDEVSQWLRDSPLRDANTDNLHDNTDDLHDLQGNHEEQQDDNRLD